MLVAPNLGSWSTLECRSALSICDTIVFKAAALGSYPQLARKELRARIALSDEHTKIARKADKVLLAKVAKAKTITVTRINSWVKAWAKAFDNYTDEVMSDIEDVVSFGNYAGKRVTYQRAFGAPQSITVYQGPPYRDRTPINERVEVSKATLDIKPSTTLEDERAIAQILKGQRFWIGKYHNDILSKQIQQIAKDILLEQGLPAKEAGAKLAQTLGYVNGYKKAKPKVTIPKGWSGSTQQYFDGVAANAATVSRIHGQMRAMVEMGIERYEIINALDERTCSRCNMMNGAVLDVRKSYQQIVDIIGGPPGAAATGAPWLSEADFASRFQTKGASGLQDDGVGYPPFHFKCRCSVDIIPDQIFTTVTIPATVQVPAGAKPVVGPREEV